MKIVCGGGSVETRPRCQSVKDAVVLFDRLASFWDRAVYMKEKPLELSTKFLAIDSVVSCDGISLEELEQTGLNCESDEDRFEENSLRCLVDSLSRDLEDLKKEHSRLRGMESEAEHVIENLQFGLRGKNDPEGVLISDEELESLHQKVVKSGVLTEKKLADVTAELECLRKSESEALANLEIARRMLEDVRSAKEAAIKRAKLAETSKSALEEELCRCFLKEREKVAIVHASAWVAETENLPRHCHRLPGGGKRAPSTGTVVEIRKARRGKDTLNLDSLELDH